ncbi:MAG TPA: hypothetical protein VGL11_09680 [Candidatus Binatia bacterium]|jgi:hypothetical protein
MQKFEPMKFLPLVFCYAALAGLASGCATTATINRLQPIEENLTRYKRVFVATAATPEVQWRDGVQYAETRLKFALLDKLRAAKKFSDVADELPAQPADSDLKIVATVTSAGAPRPSYGSPSIGIGVGGGSGGGFFGMGVGTPLPGPGSSGGLVVQVELLNAKTGRRLGFLDASATSGDAAAQAEAIAEKIVAEIARK